MNIFYAITAVMYFEGCSDPELVGSRGESHQVWQMSNPREELKLIREKLITSVVDKQLVPHRMFRDIVESIPNSESEHTFQSMHIAKERLNSIANDQLPESVRGLKDRLAMALGSEVISALMAGIPLVRELLQAAPIQFSLSITATSD